MDWLKSSINEQIDFSEILKKTLSNPIIVDHIEESAWNFMRDRSDNNMEIRAWLQNYCKDIFELCIKNISHVSKPDFTDPLRKDTFKDDCWDLVSLEWLKTNMPIYANKLAMDLPDKIFDSSSGLQYGLVKILWSFIQIFFANYYNFDYEKLIMTEEEFLRDAVKRAESTNQLIVPISHDLIENQKIIQETVKEIELTLKKEKISQN